MGKDIIVGIYVFDQDPDTGALAVDTTRKKLGSRMYFGNKFDLTIQSELRTAANNIRWELVSLIMDNLNQDLSKDMPSYQLRKPKLLGNLHHVEGHLAIPVEFQVEYPEDRPFSQNEMGYNELLPLAKVIDHNILVPMPRKSATPKDEAYATHGVVMYGKIVDASRPYGTWKTCMFGRKREFLRTELNKRRFHQTQMQEQLHTALIATQKDG